MKSHQNIQDKTTNLIQRLKTDLKLNTKEIQRLMDFNKEIYNELDKLQDNLVVPPSQIRSKENFIGVGLHTSCEYCGDYIDLDDSKHFFGDDDKRLCRQCVYDFTSEPFNLSIIELDLHGRETR